MSGHAKYHGRRAVLATRHGKERAVSPPFRSALGLEIVVPDGLDTDSLGTFTRDVPRPGTMRATAIRKARLGISASGLPLAIASEGSFGPHPAVPFLAAGLELLVFLDTETGLEIVEECLSERTNFASLEVSPGTDLDPFLARVGFPEHALVVRAGDRLVKGVTSRAHLDRLLRTEGTVQLETDMRAHVNPTRMTEIGRLAMKLAERLATPCPACAAPGYGLARHEAGLPCSGCGAPTALAKGVVHACVLCGHESHAPRTDGRKAASPAECQECNP